MTIVDDTDLDWYFNSLTSDERNDIATNISSGNSKNPLQFHFLLSK